MYLTATNKPDENSISGRYTTYGNTLTVSVNEKQNKFIKTKFELSGTKYKLGELDAAVAEMAMERVELSGEISETKNIDDQKMKVFKKCINILPVVM